MEITKWLNSWIASNLGENRWQENSVLIQTLDNPGWSIEIDVTNTILNDLVIEWVIFDKGENDWYRYNLKNGIYTAYGDLNKLEQLMSFFRNLLPEETSAIKNQDVFSNILLNSIKILENWQIINCDGDWEHENGVKIKPLNKNIWSINIDYQNTFLDNKIYEKKIFLNNDNWIEISCSNNCFKILCTFNRFDEGIESFYYDFFMRNLSSYPYTIFLPLCNSTIQIWRPIECVVTGLNEFQIVKILDFNIKELKVKNVEDFEKIDFEKIDISINCKVGDIIVGKIINLFDGVNLTSSESS